MGCPKMYYIHIKKMLPQSPCLFFTLSKLLHAIFAIFIQSLVACHRYRIHWNPFCIIDNIFHICMYIQASHGVEGKHRTRPMNWPADRKRRHETKAHKNESRSGHREWCMCMCVWKGREGRKRDGSVRTSVKRNQVRSRKPFFLNQTSTLYVARRDGSVRTSVKRN